MLNTKDHGDQSNSKEPYELDPGSKAERLTIWLVIGTVAYVKLLPS